MQHLFRFFLVLLFTKNLKHPLFEILHIKQNLNYLQKAWPKTPIRKPSFLLIQNRMIWPTIFLILLQSIH